MNASLWQLAGWTMIHSLWLGAAVALAGGFLRLACRRAAPNTRYAISLATLTLLAVTPLAAAAWLSVNGVPQVAANLESPLLPLPLGEGWGEGQKQVPAVIDLAQATPAELDALAAQHESAGALAGRTGGEDAPTHALAAQQQSAGALPTNSQPPLPLPPSTLPLPSSSQSLVTSHLLNLLPTLWLIGAPLTFTLLATGLLGSARLRRRATPLTAGAAFDACQRLRQTLNITRRVALAVSDGVAQPILVGVLRPLILLPTAALAGWTPEQLDMVLLHELAHVRRWDNLVNLLQRIVESLIFFHPAVWLLSRQVRRDREECCDAAVIAHTDRPHQYAELLVSIASALRGGPAPSLAVASAMASHPLAGRIRRILNLEEEPMRITRRTLAATLLLPLLLAGAIFYSGASAQDPPPSKGGEQPSTVASGEREQGDSPREAIRGGIPAASNSETGSPGSANQGGAATGSNADKAQSAVEEASPGAAAPIQEPEPPATDLQDEIARLEALVTKYKKEIAQLTVFDKLARNHAPLRPHINRVIREVSRLDPAAVTANKQLDNINEKLHSMAYGATTLDVNEVRRLQRRREEAAQQFSDAREEFFKEQHALLSKFRDDELPAACTERIRRLGEATKELATHQLDLDLAKKMAEARGAGGPGSPNQGGEATGSNANNDQTIANAHPSSAASAQNTTTSPYAHTGVEFTQLQNEIRNLESLIAKTQSQLVDIEIFKELSAQSGPGNPALEAAVAQELNQDPTIETFQQQIKEQLAKLKAVFSKSPNSPEVKQLLAAIQQTEGELAKHRSEAEQAVREKLTKAPNETLRAAMTEYKIRRKSVEENLAKYEQDLTAANAKLSQLKQSSHESAPFEDMKEITVAFPPGSYSEDDYNRIRKNLEDDGLAVISAPFASIDHSVGQLPSLSVFVPDHWNPKQIWESQVDGSVVCRIVNEPGGYHSFPPVSTPAGNTSQEGLKQVLSDASSRLRHEILGLKKRAAEAGGTESEAEIAASLEQKVQQWRALAGRFNDAQPTPNASPNSAAPVQEPESPSPFPTLEHQKIADRAYKLLGLELEPATSDDLQRIKKLGYAGGLRVVAVDPDKQRSLISGCLLVGLHVWPTPDLQALDAILTRDDLDELSPLKFHVVAEAPTDETRDSNKPVMEDRLITGRMPIDLEAFRSMRRTLPPNPPNAATFPNGPAPPADNAASVTVVQPPVSSISGPTKNHTQTTAYLRISFNRLPGAFSGASGTFNAADARLTPQEIELQAKNCLAIVKSSAVLKAALEKITPRETVDLQPAKAAEWLQNRLSATFPGDGEILELKLEGGDAKEDSVLLQAVVDAFIAAMNMPPESPADPNAATKSNENAADALNPFTNFAHSSSSDEVNGPPTATFLYDGKTFDQWRDLWKLELNPERRTEAINALAAFSRAGRGDEAINAILDVAAEYDFERIDDSKPVGRLKERIIESLAPEDAANAVDQWLPLLLNRLKSSPQKWDPLLIQLLARTGPPYRESFALTPENLKLLKQAAADPAYGPNARLVNHLYWSAPEDEEVAQLVKATLAGADAANAVELLRNIGYRRIEEYPEKLDLLFHPDPAIRRSARTALNHSLDPGTHDAIAAKLLAIVADPKQADRHADAIRAIAAIVKRAADMPKPHRPTLSQETIQAIADGLTPILAEGSAELIPPAYLVADKVRRTLNFKNKLTDFLSNPPEERKAPVEAALKASPDEEATLIDQPEHAGDMGGTGGGFF